jgi:hypothetical protein
LALGNSGGEVLNRLSNKIYESCRQGTISIPGFPDFQPTINALKDGQAAPAPGNYKVCVEQAGRLKILESFAGKWTETETLKDRAIELIESHNKQFNPDGEMWV